VGLLALPLPGAGVTFFAAAKKVTKESSFVTARGHTQFGHFVLQGGTRLSVALKGPIGLGSRTV
ncbi:hypothetical protein, partial [Caballeronia cordobensis]|uniref:hypothetical protein n=1 Tax=Caballeronia cordobensis TaxID=1353886 RepID=UPI001177EFF8